MRMNRLAGGLGLVFGLLLLLDCGGGSSSNPPGAVTPPANLPPIARAGANQNATSGDLVTLSGSTSSDPEGRALTYAWTQTSGTGVTLAGASSAAATFTAPAVAAAEDLVFRLTVTDGGGLHSSATTTVRVSPQTHLPPVADPGPAQYVTPGELVILDGSRSQDPSGGSLSYAWSQVSGTAVTLSDPAARELYLDAPGSSGDLVFSLRVTNGSGLSDTATVTVAVGATPPEPPRTTVTLIDEAVSRGDITAEKGLVYKVFALFGDTRLPVSYRGAETDLVNGTDIMAEVYGRYATMSAEGRTEVYPFLLPAYVTNSWYSLASARQLTKARMVSAAPPVWKSVGTGKVKVWYEDGVSVTIGGVTKTEASLASGVLTAAETVIWPKLKTLMGNAEPLSDAGMVPPPLPNANYGAIPGNYDANGALDIILCRGMNASGYTVPHKAVPTPAFITLDCTMWPLGDDNTPGLVQIAAHEMMHAWQFRYPRLEASSTYAWLMEATAAWTEDYIYPKANSENRYAQWYLDTPHLPIDDQTNFRQYGLYLPFSYWTNGDEGVNASVPPEVVKNAWENAATLGCLEAVDQAYPPPFSEGLPRQFNAVFERFWADALVAAWNRGEDAYFLQKDKLSAGAKRRCSPVNASLGGSADRAFFLDDLDPSGAIELPYLSGRYYHFVFTEDAVRTVMFYDGLRSKLQLMAADDGTMIYFCEPVQMTNPPEDPVEGAQWRLIVKIDGKWKRWEPTQGYTTGPVTFCRDAKAERIQELVVVLANSSPDKAKVIQPPELAPVLLLSNLGSWGWEGTITALHEATDTGEPKEESTASVQYRRGQDIYPDLFPASATPPGVFVLKQGTFSWSISGSYDGCSTSGSDAWSWSAPIGGVPQDGPESAFRLVPEARSGRMYRTFEGDGYAGTHECPYTITCPGADPPVTNTSTKPMWWKSDADGVLAGISSNGTTLSGEAEYQGTKYQWNLHAVREP